MRPQASSRLHEQQYTPKVLVSTPKWPYLRDPLRKEKSRPLSGYPQNSLIPLQSPSLVCRALRNERLLAWGLDDLSWLCATRKGYFLSLEMGLINEVVGDLWTVLGSTSDVCETLAYVRTLMRDLLVFWLNSIAFSLMNHLKSVALTGSINLWMAITKAD